MVRNSSQITRRDVPPIVAEAQQRATAVVLAYRAVDWDAVESGEDPPAVQALLSACELHDATHRFLDEEDVGEVGAKLDKGLDRFYASEVGPRLGKPKVLRQLSRQPAGAPSSTGATEDGVSPRSRPQVTVGHTVRMNTGCGHLYVTVNESEDGKPFELFNHMGKAGGCAASQNEAIGRLISYALRCGAQLDPLIKQLKGISCHRPAWGEGGKISSCSDAIGKALETYHGNWKIREEQGLVASSPESRATNGGTAARRMTDPDAPVAFEPAERWNGGAVASSGDSTSEPASNNGHGKKPADIHRVQGACVDCGGQLSFEEGCVKCHSCGFTECG